MKEIPLDMIPVEMSIDELLEVARERGLIAGGFRLVSAKLNRGHWWIYDPTTDDDGENKLGVNLQTRVSHSGETVYILKDELQMFKELLLTEKGEV